MKRTVNIDADDLADVIAWLEQLPSRPAVIELLLTELRVAQGQGES